VVQGRELTQALDGRVTKHHCNIIHKSLRHLAFLEQTIAELETRHGAIFALYRQDLDLLGTVDSVGPNMSSVLAELGTDMSVFPSEAHVSSWVGLSPGNNESASKKRTRPIKGNKELKSALLEAAWATSKKRNSYTVIANPNTAASGSVKKFVLLP
jgi:transposase